MMYIECYQVNYRTFCHVTVQVANVHTASDNVSMSSMTLGLPMVYECIHV